METSEDRAEEDERAEAETGVDAPEVEVAEDEARAKGTAAVPEGFLEALRESLQEIVASALREAAGLKRKGGDWRATLETELERARLEVRRAVQTARAGMPPLDVKRIKRELQGRANTLMTRVKDADLERIDLLVEAGLFESRSEAAAFLIHAGLEARRDLLGRVEDTAQRIGELKEQLRRELAGEEE